MMPTPSMGKRPTKTALEWDVVDRRWRRLLCITQRAGVTNSVKRQMRRRERHEAKGRTNEDQN